MDIDIRHTEPEDYRALQQIFSQPSVQAGTLQLPYPAIDKWKNRLAKSPDNGVFLVAEVDGKVRGSIAIMINIQSPRRRHSAELGMAVHDDCQRQGLGRALLAAAIDMADNWLQISRLELTVFTNNEAAVELYKQFGFEQEGVLRQYAMQAGVLRDVYAMGRIKPSVG